MCETSTGTTLFDVTININVNVTAVITAVDAAVAVDVAIIAVDVVWFVTSTIYNVAAV